MKNWLLAYQVYIKGSLIIADWLARATSMGRFSQEGLWMVEVDDLFIYHPAYCGEGGLLCGFLPYTKNQSNWSNI